MAPLSAGLLMYRIRDGRLEVFLVHPGGPFFARRDEGAWTLPKGEVGAGEELLDTARREFEEEVGARPNGPYLELGEVTQRGGKVVRAWAFQGSIDRPEHLTSNTFELEWPPHSGRRQRFPEVDRGAFFGLPEARKKINPAQQAFLDRLRILAEDRGPS